MPLLLPIQVLKTTVQMLAIIVLILVTESSPYYLIWLGLAMIYLAALLGLYSAYLYFKAAMPSLSGS